MESVLSHVADLVRHTTMTLLGNIPARARKQIRRLREKCAYGREYSLKGKETRKKEIRKESVEP